MGIFAIFVLSFVFIVGLKERVVTNAGALVAHLIAIPLAGISYHLLASLFSFLPGDSWENLVGFFAAKYLIIAILYFPFLFFARRLFKKVWKKGIFVRLIGGVLTTLNSAIGMVTLVVAVEAFSISGWLGQVLLGSSFLDWLVTNLSFVKSMLPFA
ncbi:hypothetical protein ACFLV6_00545 [Chloroflexota bacterium]